ncbi:zinc finger CCCH domain-containing protein 24 [Musa acuminata AAA Group]|uniref:zinc finger CCCH domain-containing protein 24 n=1 Tax=Musa acuminata AAA Group TaxID=214697 RepID=UPI0031D3F491
MCGGPERVGPSSPSPASREDNGVMDYITDDSFSSLLELAANNDAGGFRRSLDRDPSAVDKVCLWYGREKGSNRMVLERHTPLMVAATYGSLDVLGLLLSSPSVLVNRASGRDRATALHCAASGGSPDAADAVRLLLSAGADPDLVDANGRRPADVVIVPPKLPDVRIALEELLGKRCDGSGGDQRRAALHVITGPSNSDSQPLSSSLDSDGSPPITTKASELQPPAVPEKKEYPVDPSLPDIKNSIYATDEFRMYSFKVRPCSRAYSHDWTECPFVHPGENARRRDPRKYHYSCVPCPDYRKGACRRGDMCEYAHGVFECWLHPAQYRTRPCKDGTSCSRRVCFFAHTNEELRPLHTATDSALPSPLSSASAAMEMAAALSLMPGSPSSVSSVMSPFTPPMSPSANGIGHSSFSWAHSNMPAVHLPGSNLQSSRLRASLSARDMPVDEFSAIPECDGHQLLNEMCHSRLSSSLGSAMARSKAFTLDDFFSAEPTSSPKYNSDQGAIFSPSHMTTALNQFQRQQQSLLSPINTVFSPKSMDGQQVPGHSVLLQASLGASSPVRMSPRNMESISPVSSHLSLLAQREKQKLMLRSLSSRDAGSGTYPVVGSPVNHSWLKWASPTSSLDWEVNGEELGCLRQPSPFELQATGEEPDLSWVHSLVRDSPAENVVAASGAPAGLSSSPHANGIEGLNRDGQSDDLDQAALLGSWLDQLQLDQMVI